jgi:hypothetical protein
MPRERVEDMGAVGSVDRQEPFCQQRRQIVERVVECSRRKPDVRWRRRTLTKRPSPA